MKPRLLVIELHHFGDAVLALPFLRAAQAHYEVKVFCTPAVAGMFQGLLPGLAVESAAESWPERFRQAAGALREWLPDVTVCAWSDARCHLAARLTGARRRVGFSVNEQNFYGIHLGWRLRRLWMGAVMERSASLLGLPLLTESLIRSSRDNPHLHNWQQLAACINIAPDLTVPWFAPPKLDFGLAEFLDRTRGKPLWVLHPGGRLPTKRWPVERYQAVLEQFFAPRAYPVVIVQTPGEPAPQPVSSWQIQWTAGDHQALAGLLDRADFLLCNDSYPAHLAAALGTKVFSIFGSGSPDWFAPFANAQNVIRRDVCPYHPCIDRCLMPDYVCLKAVEEGLVISRLDSSVP